MSDVRAHGSTFVAREAPDAADYVARSISASPYRHVARIRYFAPKDVVAQCFSPSSVTIEADGRDACVVTAGADDPERMVLYFATVGVDFKVLEPPEVAVAVGSVVERLRRAAISP
jgi:predicted DNA-binding transcriptional regulator YafY